MLLLIGGMGFIGLHTTLRLVEAGYRMFNPASRMCHAALKGEEPDFSDRPNGTLTDADASDWTYVKDVARSIQLLHTADTLNHHIYNIGSGQATNNRQMFDAVRDVIPEAR